MAKMINPYNRFDFFEDVEGNQKRLRGFVSDDAYYDRVDAYNKKYFKDPKHMYPDIYLSEQNEKKNIVLSDNEKLRLKRNIAILLYASERGYLGIEWDNLFELKWSYFQRLINNEILLLQKKFPEVIASWNKDYLKVYNEQKNKGLSK